MSDVFDFAKIKAIIGLGNPGPQYYKTRHSIGFRAVDELVNDRGSGWRLSGNMEVSQIDFGLDNRQVLVIKPLTFMNNSGQVISFLQKKGIKPEEILVVHDELEKKFGDISLRFGGSARGHNGLRSIIGMIGDGFWRLRIGIDRPADKSEVSEYVLGRFLPQEEQKIDELLALATKKLA